MNPAIPDTLPEYWRDLAYLLKIYRADQDKAPARQVRTLRKKIKNPVFGPYIDKRQRSAEKRDATLPSPIEQTLFVEAIDVSDEK